MPGGMLPFRPIVDLFMWRRWGDPGNRCITEIHEAWGVLGDLLASLSIALDQPFVIGDFVIVGEHMGTVEYIKKFGVKGNGLLIASMVSGILWGAGYFIATNAVPVDFPGWFGLVIFGSTVGLMASGLYDSAVGIAAKVTKL